MKGVIFVNPFLITKQSESQAERLKEEFNKRGVQIEIIKDGYLKVAITGAGASIDLPALDFAVYLDKDKYLSEILERSGLRLFNRHEAVRICDDKGQTYLKLLGHGVNIPKTIFGALCYNQTFPIQKAAVENIGKKIGYPVIVKESFGSLGKGVYMATDEEKLYQIMEKVKTKPHLFQEYLGKRKGVDVRVIVIGGKTVAAMERCNLDDFRSNVAQGGFGKEITLCENFKAVAESCAKILGLDYCGVDILYGDNDQPVVCEVNSNAFFDGIESVTGVNVAGAYVDHVIKTIKEEKSNENFILW